MNSRPKILMVTRQFPSDAMPTRGTFCLERARALSELADVRVICPTPYVPGFMSQRGGKAATMAAVQRRSRTDFGVQVSYPRYFSFPKILTFTQGLTMADAVRRDLAASHGGWLPDVIDGHFAFPDGYSAVRLARSLRRPVTVTCHGSDLRDYPPLKVTRRLLQWTMKSADRVIGVSRKLTSIAVELGCPPEHAEFLCNAVDTDKFTIRDQAQCRRRLGLPVDGRLAVSVGTLIDLKNQQVLIGALAEMVGAGVQPPRLALVGDGPNRAMLEQQARTLGVADHVHFAGTQPFDEVPNWLAAADWMVHGSKREGWPTVYFEAMSCGRPVITSPVDCATDAIPGEAYGLVVESNDERAFARALGEAQSREFSAETIRAYAQQHSWKSWAQRYMEIIRQIRDPMAA